MTTHDVVSADRSASRDTKAIVDAYIALMEVNRGMELTDVLTDDAVLDLNVPQWRFQVGGGQAIAAAFARSYPGGFRTTGYRWEPTPSGAVVESDGWDVASDTYYRHLAWLGLRDDRIARLTTYCTGEWDADTIARQRREAPMVDDELTGGTR